MSLITELQRRNVFKVSAAYLALGWVVVQATATLTPAFHLPDSALPLVTWIGAIGFPFVVMFAWIYELTPEGLKRESEIDRSQSITHLTSKRLDYLIIGMLALAIAVTVLDRLLPGGTQPAASSVGAGPARDNSAVPGAEGDRAQGALLQEHEAAPDEKSIAVLPFVNMSSDKEQEYFSDGIAEELLNLLAKIPELRVAARTSSFSFKGKDTEIAEIARRLNVAHVLEGSVRKSGNTVRITAQLVRAADGYHLWSETWDRTLEDIFAVQDEIAAAVVAQMKITLLGAAPKSRVTDPKAYALFLRAKALSEQFTPQGYQESSALFEQVLAIDPNYLEAWRKLAANRFNEAAVGLLPIDEAYRQAREYIGKALAIDPDFARGHDGLANIALFHDHDPRAAAAHWQRALALDPANPDILNNANALSDALGRHEQSIAVAEYVIARDPASAIAHAAAGGSYLFAGRLDQAIAAYRNALALSPGYLGASFYLGHALLLQGDARAALAAFGAETAAMWRLAGLAVAHHALGASQQSDTALAELIDKHEKSAAYLIAGALAWRGENDRAFEWLDKAIANHDTGLGSIATDPWLTKLHADPRWLPFLHTLGFAPEQLAAIPFDVKLPD